MFENIADVLAENICWVVPLGMISAGVAVNILAAVFVGGRKRYDK